MDQSGDRHHESFAFLAHRSCRRGACCSRCRRRAQAGVGDLLVAPTRIVLDGRKGAEIILNNIGEEPATYRVSVEFRRMTEDGSLADVTEPTAQDKIAEDMIVYAPRRVTLAPHEPQSIRIAARAPQGLPDGEYRVHMLFRAIPPADPGRPARQAPTSPQGPALPADPRFTA